MNFLQDTFRFLNNWLTIYIGRWAGVPTYLHWTWTIFFLIILAVSPPLAVTFLGLFWLVQLHELGHCLAARRYGIEAHQIVLTPIGGMAMMQVPCDPWEELVVSIAGPLVNVAMIPVLWVASGLSEIFEVLALYNLVLLLFNLLPAFPMDGGRVFRAVLCLITHDRPKSTLVAVRVGQVLGVLMAIYGIVGGNFGLLFIAYFVAMAGEGELRQVRDQAAPHDEDDGHARPHDDPARESAEMLREIEDRMRNGGR